MLPGPPACPPLPGPPSEPSPSEPPPDRRNEPGPASKPPSSSNEPPLKQAKIVPAPETSEFVHKASPKHHLTERPALAGDCRVPKTPDMSISDNDDVQKDEKDGGQHEGKWQKQECSDGWQRSDGWQWHDSDGWQRSDGWQWHDSGDQGKWQKQEWASAAEEKWQEWAFADMQRQERASAVDGQNDGGQHDGDGAARPADAPAAIGVVPQLLKAPPPPPKPPAADDSDSAAAVIPGTRHIGFGKIPVLGEDVTWFGCRPIVSCATEWADDSSFEATAEFLYKHGLYGRHKKQFCGYCRDFVQDAKWHLDGYSRESKKHFRSCVFISHAQDELAVRGPLLKTEGVTILAHCFSCDVCCSVGTWDAVWEHIESKQHKKKLAEVMEPEIVAKFQKCVPSEETQAWASLFPTPPLVQLLEPPPSTHQQTVRKINPACVSTKHDAGASVRTPAEMDEPPPLISELETNVARASERQFPKLAPPLWWGRCFGKRGMGIWCSECLAWVGWGKFGQRSNMIDPDGFCCHYGQSKKTSLLQASILYWMGDGTSLE